MSLNLDARQRAMLLEMGVRVWQPLPKAAEESTVTNAVTSAATASPPTAEVRAAVPHQPFTTASTPALASSATWSPTSGPSLTASVVPSTAFGVQVDAAPLDWDALQQAVSTCRACGLCESRKHTVFGVGQPRARWLIVGEAPGEQEDLQGQPFVGPAGQLLDNMLKAVGMSRQEGVFITNVLKCRPPANRNPQPPEMAQCAPFLERQIELVQPQLIIALGRFAAQSLLQHSVPDVVTIPLGKLRGQLRRYQKNSINVPVVVSYHPAYLLRAPAEKAKAWADWCLALATSES